MATKLPAKYAYLEAPDMPLVIKEALKLYGTWEWAGKDNNPVILGWAKTLGIDHIYTGDSMAWCGLVVAYVLTRAKKHVPLSGYDLLRALKYKDFGIPVSEPMIGDVLIFNRQGGGHTGFYVGETATTYAVLGGNQNNQMNISELDKMRLVAVRRPVYINQPLSVRQMVLNSSGITSINEA